ncbi:DUF2083 domain-containing protein [Rhodobacteraceae bacterium NNCM2]|nr:DUF2083 domain-containing protein [Coraliihabitans acroporae]
MRSTIAGIRIRERRRAAGITQAALAAMMEISPSYLNLIERNKRSVSPGLVRRAAEALELRVDELDGTSEMRLAEQLREIAADPRLAPLRPERDLAGEFTGRYPGWARALTALARAERESGELATSLADRLTHDPFLGESVHSMLTHIAAFRSISEILVSVDEIEPEQRRRFHAILSEQSHKLSEVGEALAAYFDKAHTSARAVTPLDEVEALFEDNANRFEVIETGGSAAIDAFIDRSEQLQTASAHSRARRALETYADDVARTGPGFAEYARSVKYDLDRMTAETALAPDVICRRLTALPEGHPKFGYVLANAAGTILDLRTLPGFQPARNAAFCPIWALARAAQTPERAILQFAAFPNGQRFVLVARARPTGSAAFGAPRHYVTDMLVIPEQGASATIYAPAQTQAVEAVGTTCRVCPRESCPHRTEDPIIG